MEGVKDSGGVDLLDEDLTWVKAPWTTMESAEEAAEDNEVVDAEIPVRRTEAARRGRLVVDGVAVLADAVLFALSELAFMLILAASWFSDGTPSGSQWGCEVSTGPVAAGGGVVVIVVTEQEAQKALKGGDCPLSILCIGSSTPASHLVL